MTHFYFYDLEMTMDDTTDIIYEMTSIYMSRFVYEVKKGFDVQFGQFYSTHHDFIKKGKVRAACSLYDTDYYIDEVILQYDTDKRLRGLVAEIRFNEYSAVYERIKDIIHKCELVLAFERESIVTTGLILPKYHKI